MKLHGLHHITAMAGDPQKNVDFYVGVLGLRLVKKTVNFDDPGTYHLYYGDQVGSPGTILTFFPWPGARHGKAGVGAATRLAFQVRSGSLPYWINRLQGKGISSIKTRKRFKQESLEFCDPDGIALEIIETENPRSVKPWVGSDVPLEHALHGFSGVTLTLLEKNKTADLLMEVMGAQFDGEDGEYTRYSLGDGAQSTKIDLIEEPLKSSGGGGAGTIHHIAWETPSDAEQVEWQKRLVKDGFDVSPVMDRNYFNSIYFREPGHVLFEIATTPPGFMVDEPVESLGEKLMLPAWLESNRNVLEASLPKLLVPGGAS
jgi:glyoxalase family protein